MQIMRQYNVDTGSLIHALQNHDELTMGIGHFEAHAADLFSFRGRQMTGKQVRDTVRAEMYAKLIEGPKPYNMKFGAGVSSTTATVITSTLGIRDIHKLSATQVEKVKRLHLLLAFYNAFQPGVFALSGWDLVGALTLPPDSVRDRLADGDTRWINRGAYDLLGANARATRSAAGLPVATAIYGPVPRQLKNSKSFASQLARMLKVRSDMRLYAGQLADIPNVQAKGLLVLVHQLPDNGGREITAINFGSTAVDESVTIQGVTANAKAVDALEPQAAAIAAGAGGTLRLQLQGYEGKAFRISE
jgi:trehalose synthase